MTQVDRSNRGQLMDDHLRPSPAHGLRDLIGIKRVRDHRHSAQLVEHRLLRLATRHAMNLMTGGNQTRRQLLSNRSRRSCHKLKGWVDGPAVIEHLDVVGSYNLFGTQREESAVRAVR